MATWDRFDICAAALCLEWDYNQGGWLQERPTNQRRMESTGVQLHRMQFVAEPCLSFDNLSENGQEIYLENVLKLQLPMDDEMQKQMAAMFVPEYLHKMRPEVWSDLQAQA